MHVDIEKTRPRDANAQTCAQSLSPRTHVLANARVRARASTEIYTYAHSNTYDAYTHTHTQHTTHRHTHALMHTYTHTHTHTHTRAYAHTHTRTYAYTPHTHLQSLSQTQNCTAVPRRTAGSQHGRARAIFSHGGHERACTRRPQGISIFFLAIICRLHKSTLLEKSVENKIPHELPLQIPLKTPRNRAGIRLCDIEPRAILPSVSVNSETLQIFYNISLQSHTTQHIQTCTHLSLHTCTRTQTRTRTISLIFLFFVSNTRTHSHR